MKTYIIYMAAGNSRRFGTNKLLYLFHQKPLYRHTLDKLLENHFEELIVVSQYQEIIDEMKTFSQVHTIYNPDSYDGISYTIKAALDYLKDQPKPFWMMFVVADQPYLSVKTISTMIKVAKQSSKTLLTAAYLNQVGNPTMFHSQYLDELYTLHDDQGGRCIMKRYPNEVEKIYVEDKKELEDFDYFDDFIKNEVM